MSRPARNLLIGTVLLAVAAVAAVRLTQGGVKSRLDPVSRERLEQAEAGLVALKANLKKIKDGARTEEKRQIEATVQQARAGLDNARTDLKRIENLYAAGAISKQTLDATRTGATRIVVKVVGTCSLYRTRTRRWQMSAVVW